MEAFQDMILVKNRYFCESISGELNQLFLQLQLFRRRFCGNVVKSKTFPYSHRIKGLKIWQRINSLLCNYISMKGVKSICRKGSNLLTINSIQKCSQEIFGFCLIDKRQTNTFFLLTCLKHYIYNQNAQRN